MGWKNIPPDQKPNWGRLNEGQRRYAFEQYKLALVRRGLSIDHPVPAVEETAKAPEPESHGTQEAIQESKAGQSAALPEASKSGATASAKKRKTDAGHESLPGTAEGQASGPMEGGPRDMALPNPTIGVHSHVRFYRKVHRFLTFGIAYDILTTSEGTPKYNVYWMTTPLAKIPWDRPYLYINPAEFALLPNGSHCVGCRVSVISRNVRIAFPTNSSESNLATLNQNKDIIVGQGLNKTVHMKDVTYNTFQADQPMIPQTFLPETSKQHQTFITELYGDLDLSTANPQTVPRHQMGIPAVLPWYGVLCYGDSVPGSDPMGFQCLQHYYKDCDADSITGNEVISIAYKPSVGLLNKPITSYYQGYPMNPLSSGASTVKIPRQGMDFQKHQEEFNYNLAQNGTTPVSNTETVTKWAGNAIPFDLTSPIEKSQHVRIGNFKGEMVQAQDSLHIGLQPVVALTTAALGGKSNSSFTDSQAYFEVIAEMEVNCDYPSPWPLHTAGPLVTEHGTTWFGAAEPDYYNKTTFNGLYQAQ
nr:MAG: VP2 [Parvoviridae sp.]